ncbi:MAG: phosphotransferase [Actinomycetota bacterium]
MSDDDHLPQTPDELTPEYLGEALSELLDGRPVVGVTSEAVGTDDGMVALLHRLHLEVEGGGAAPTVIAKVPNEVAEVRATAQIVGVYEREIRAYLDLLPDLPIRTPGVHVARFDPDPAARVQAQLKRGLDALPVPVMRRLLRPLFAVAGASDRRYLLIIDDLAPAETGDQEGESTDRVAAMLAVLARVHAHHWDGRALDRAPWLDPLGDTTLIRAYWRRHHERIRARHEALGAGWFDRLDTLDGLYGLLMEQLAMSPTTLLHGDPRFTNFLFPAEGDPFLIDWQILCTGPAAWDVTYLLHGGLTDEQWPERTALVDAYLEALAAEGVEVDRDAFDRDLARAALAIAFRMVVSEDITAADDLGRTGVTTMIRRMVTRMGDALPLS